MNIGSIYTGIRAVKEVKDHNDIVSNNIVACGRFIGFLPGLMDDVKEKSRMINVQMNKLSELAKIIKSMSE